MRIAALGTAAGVLVALELLLRLAVGGAPPLFESVEGQPGLLQANPRLIERPPRDRVPCNSPKG